MMIQSIRAIYENGQLRLLDPVNLAEGQEVSIAFVSDRERTQAALSDLLVHPNESLSDDLNETTLLNEIEAAFQGQPPLSDTIIEERREGP
jgi:predicted DNA-binding antitoxin AbrB/MazE fold protein